MRALRFLLLIWLGVTMLCGLAAVSPIRFDGLKIVLGLGMIVHGLPFIALVGLALAVQALAFCYIWAARPL